MGCMMMTGHASTGSGAVHVHRVRAVIRILILLTFAAAALDYLRRTVRQLLYWIRWQFDPTPSEWGEPVRWSNEFLIAPQAISLLVVGILIVLIRRPLTRWLAGASYTGDLHPSQDRLPKSTYRWRKAVLCFWRVLTVLCLLVAVYWTTHSAMRSWAAVRSRQEMGFSTDSRGPIVWYIFELAENGRKPVGFGIAGVVLALLMLKQGSILRWLVPLRGAACPSCDHSLTGLTSPRCPECGVELPREWFAEDEPNVSSSEKDSSNEPA